MTEIERYFNGEKLQCSIGIGIAIISIAVAFFFYFQLKTDFYKGFAYPFFIIPVLLLVICVSVVMRTPSDIARVNGFLQNDKTEIRTTEIPRTEGVMKTFKILMTVEICLLLGGTAMFFLLGIPLWKGVGTGLALQAAIMLCFDYFASQRGKVYLDYLHSIT